jgi:hypothetical protein
LGLTLFEVGFPAYNFGESDVLSHICNLDGDALALGRVRNDNDESPLDTSDPVTLVTDIFDLDIALLALVDGWFRWTPIACRHSGWFFSLSFGRGRRRKECNSVGLASVEIAELNFSLWNFDNVLAVSLFNRGGIQTAKALRYFHKWVPLNPIHRGDHLILPSSESG